MQDDKQILTISEAAEYLKLGKRTIYKLARNGMIPGKRVLNRWRFEKESLRKWIAKSEND